MRRILIVALGVMGLGAALTACGDEDPTGVGSPLIGPGVRTFEVVLDADAFLQADTTYDSFGRFRDAGFRILANDFEGELNANTVFRVTRPFTVTYQPPEGPAVTDSIRSIRGATLTLILDTLATTPAPISVEVLPLTESWDQGTVTWELRSDTSETPVPWTTPGGTAGPVAGMGIWNGGDTLVVRIDSADAAVWQDTAAARLGGLIRPVTEGSRLRVRSIQFAFDVVPDAEIDTVLTAGGVAAHMHIATPEPPPALASELRVGGLPAWRSLLNFRSMRDLVVDACGSGGTGTGDPACDVALSDVSLNLATLLLDPTEAGAHRVEGPIRIEGRAVLQAENVSILRAPLTASIGTMLDSIPPEFFTGAAPPGAVVAVPVTTYIRNLVNADTAGVEPLWLALVGSVARVELGMFGYTAFSSLESANPPRLRLVLSLPNEEIFQ